MRSSRRRTPVLPDQKADVSAFQGIGASACEMFCAHGYAAARRPVAPRLQLAQP